MRVTGINSINFGIYRKESITEVGDEKINTLHGRYKDYKVTVYRQYAKKKLVSKLFYISDLVGNFIRLKLMKIDDNGNRKTMLKQGRY